MNVTLKICSILTFFYQKLKLLLIFTPLRCSKSTFIFTKQIHNYTTPAAVNLKVISSILFYEQTEPNIFVAIVMSKRSKSKPCGSLWITRNLGYSVRNCLHQLLSPPLYLRCLKLKRGLFCILIKMYSNIS